MEKLVILFAFAASIAHGNVNFGKKIEFAINDGRPSLGVQMTSNLMAITFAINTNEITQGKSVSKIQMRFADKITGEFLSDLIVLGEFPDGLFFPGTASFTTSLTGNDALKVQSMLKTSALLLGVKDGNNSVFVGYVDLGQHCVSSKNQFLNIDTGATGCPSQSAYKVAKLSPCLSKVVTEGAWIGKISSELQCLVKNTDFNNGMAFLCTKDQSNLSVQYQKYIALNTKVNAAFIAYKNAQDPTARMQALQDLEDTKRQLSMFGYKNEVQQALSAAGSAHESCQVN